MSFWHTSRERHGLRAWWHFGDGRRQIGLELGWWHHFCHAAVSCDDDGWNLSLAFPPLFFHVSLDGWPIWRPTKATTFTWETPPRVVQLPDQRECRVAIFDWKVWITPWGKSMEWVGADPWWVRGVTFDIKRAIIGPTAYTIEKIGEPFDVAIEMPEGAYRAVFTRQRQTWKPRRWFATVRESFDVDIPKGIPFAGKGENSWDCGDDGLFGTGAEGTVEEAAAKVRDSVLESRRRYGMPSNDAILAAREA